MHVLPKKDQPAPKKFENKCADFMGQLSIEQLCRLNEMVVDRIKMLEKIEDITAASAFKRGHKVQWEYEGNTYNGAVVRVNQKTITVTEIKEPYRQWKISPLFLNRIF